ncbi:MAG: hypothetical protein AAB421_02785 [Patescibacteria group bacterium]
MTSNGNGHAAKTRTQLAFDAMEAAVAENVCMLTGRKGAQYVVHAGDGTTGTDGKPVLRHQGFVIRKNKKGRVTPNAASECPADRLAAKLTEGGVNFDIHPTRALREFLRVCGEERQETATAGSILESILKSAKPKDEGPTALAAALQEAGFDADATVQGSEPSQG